MARISGIVGAGTLVATAVLFLSESPGKLESFGFWAEEEGSAAPTAIEVPDAEFEPAKQPEEELSAPSDPLADLAPESFSPDQSVAQAGFGTAFGEGGAGPAVGSASGIGGDSSRMAQEAGALDRSAQVLARGQPDYPPEAKSRGVTGHVTLRMRVGISGQLEEVGIQESVPPGVFDEAALRAVRAWRFQAALAKGKPSATWLTQRVRFDLN